MKGLILCRAVSQIPREVLQLRTLCGWCICYTADGIEQDFHPSIVPGWLSKLKTFMSINCISFTVSALMCRYQLFCVFVCVSSVIANVTEVKRYAVYRGME